MADCHVELATLAAIESLATIGLDWMQPSERQRLDRITAPLRRRQFLAGHWLVRDLAARCRGGTAADWRLDADARGQPALRHRHLRLAASISHSGGLVAVAVANQAIGLDLECPARARDWGRLAEFTFSPDECRALATSPPDVQARTFLSTWALKEAYGKRSGDGLQPSQARRMQAHPTGPEEAEGWLWQFADGSVLALAAWPGAGVELQAIKPLPVAATWRYAKVADTGQECPP